MSSFNLTRIWSMHRPLILALIAPRDSVQSHLTTIDPRAGLASDPVLACSEARCRNSCYQCKRTVNDYDEKILKLPERVACDQDPDVAARFVQ
jgi:hypothetical protein